MIRYHITIDRDDDDTFADDISGRVLALRWRLGMDQPYASMAARTWARVTVDNRDRSFGEGLARLRLRIESDDGAVRRTHFVGFIGAVIPDAGDHGPGRAVIEAHGPEVWLSTEAAHIAPAADARADALIGAILDAIPFRRAGLARGCLIDAPGANLIDTAHIFPAAAADHLLEPGKSRFAYYGDFRGEAPRADRAIADLAASERGRFFTDRLGRFVFYNRHHTMLGRMRVASFDEAMDALDCRYGAEVINRVTVIFRPRALGAANSRLWALAHPQRLRPGARYIFSARYADAYGEPVGALDLIGPIPGIHFSAAGPDLFGDFTAAVRVRVMAAGADSARVEVRSTAAIDVWLTALELRGTPLPPGDPLALTVEDGLSAARYGPGALTLDLPALSSAEEAEQIARYEIARRSAPHTVAESLTLDVAGNPAALALTLFDRIGVRATQAGHADDALIIGEAHEIDRGGASHRVTWLLEPADSSRFVVIDDGLIDGDAVIVPY